MTFVKKVHTKDSDATFTNANDLENRIELGFTDILLFMNPIGTIYQSVNNVNPSTFLGGTWEEFAKGRTLVGVDDTQTEFNDIEKTGGEKTHTLTISEIAEHDHYLENKKSHSDGAMYGASANSGATTNLGGNTNIGYRYFYDIKSQKAGGGQPHNNLQPYITVYMWKRIA